MTTYEVHEETTEVVVVGAGMSGLTAATTLAKTTAQQPLSKRR